MRASIFSSSLSPARFGPVNLVGPAIGGSLAFTYAASTMPTKALASGLAASSINLVNRALGLIPLLVASAEKEAEPSFSSFLALGPVYVWDIFPAGTDYLGSSLKPDRLQPGYANWSLLYLGIGQSVNINLRLNVTDPRDELVNVVYASGGHNDQWISAGNMSVMQFGWLSCCQPEMLVEKQARIDAADSRLIWYRILLKNQANVSLVAQVTDRLPAGLQLLNASAEPQVEGLDLAWVTTAIPAGESRFIEYRAQATKNGKFVNTARVEAHALDGSGGASAAGQRDGDGGRGDILRRGRLAAATRRRPGPNPV